MASPLITIKQNDTSPSVVLYLQGHDPVSGALIAQNLISAKTVTFSMRDAATGVVKINKGLCTIVDNATGKVQYAWGATDTLVAGTYQAEVEVTFQDNSVMTFPNDGYITVIITPQIA